MPERTPYDEAMMLSQARLRVPDADLKHGQVETISMQTNAGVIKRPWGIQGGFAVVYKFRTQSGKMRALRCFLVQTDPDMQFRYERISAYFAAHASDITVEFKYYDSGIVLKENIQGQLQNRTYPIIEMEWIEGMTLVEGVDELCRKRDQAGLADVIDQWIAILRTLRQARISHGDLAGVNVMIRPNGRLVLVDYDGVYIPDFANRPQILLGQADYQHPQMHLRPFNEQTDNFSALVIYTALVALHAKPELWNKYMRRGSQTIPLETNLLFLQQDFIDPDRSSLFADLEQINNARLRAAVQTLKHACRQSGTQSIDISVLDPDFEKQQALIQLEQAIHNDDDQEIIKAWIPALLDNYGPAQQYIARVEHARKVVQALNHFLNALQTQSMQQITAAYDPILNNCKNITPQQQEQLLYALDFMQAYYTENDQEIVAAWEAIQNSVYKGKFALTVPEQQRLRLAEQRKTALVKFRMAVINKNTQQIVASYDSPLLDACTGVTLQERTLLQVAQDFAQAYQGDDDQEIAAASDEIENFSYRAHLNFTAQEQQRIALARQRKLALVKFRLGLMSKNAQQIIANYDWILDDCKSVTAQERDILQIAKDFVQAYHKGDDEAIVAIWDTIQQKSYQIFFIFTEEVQQRITFDRQRKAALTNFRQALTSKSARSIVANYDTVLDSSKAITREERDMLQAARDFVQAYQNSDDQAIVLAWEAMQDSCYQQSFIFTQEEQQRITLSQQRKDALIKFRRSMISNRNIQYFVASYDSVLDHCKNVTQSEREQLKLARDFVQAYQSYNDQTILSAWLAIQNSPYKKSFALTPAELQRISLAQTRSVEQGGFPHA